MYFTLYDGMSHLICLKSNSLIDQITLIDFILLSQPYDKSLVDAQSFNFPFFHFYKTRTGLHAAWFSFHFAMISMKQRHNHAFSVTIDQVSEQSVVFLQPANIFSRKLINISRSMELALRLYLHHLKVSLQ